MLEVTVNGVVANARDTLADALSRSWLDRPAHELDRDLERQDLTARLDRLAQHGPDTRRARAESLSAGITRNAPTVAPGGVRLASAPDGQR